VKYKEHKQYRLPSYNYSKEGNYFITICTKNREEFFGRIEKDKMILSPVGAIANIEWKKLADKFQNILLDEFIIMPDHMHGIIIIKNVDGDMSCRNTPRRVPTNDENNNPVKNLHPLIKNSISSIINHYKGSVKKWCNKNGYNSFKWQARFYDRIIRDDKELFFIQKYIIENPLNWIKDKS
jgi:putative transposase